MSVSSSVQGCSDTDDCNLMHVMLKICSATTLPKQSIRQPRFEHRPAYSTLPSVPVCAACAHTCLDMKDVVLQAHDATPFTCCCRVMGQRGSCHWHDDPHAGTLSEDDRAHLATHWAIEQKNQATFAGPHSALRATSTAEYVQRHRDRRQKREREDGRASSASMSVATANGGTLTPAEIRAHAAIRRRDESMPGITKSAAAKLRTGSYRPGFRNFFGLNGSSTPVVYSPVSASAPRSLAASQRTPSAVASPVAASPAPASPAPTKTTVAAGSLTPPRRVELLRRARAECAGIGIDNKGNTCYAASVIQLLLFRTPLVRRALEAAADAADFAPIDRALLDIMRGAAPISALASHLDGWEFFRQQDPHEFWALAVVFREPEWAKRTLRVTMRGVVKGVLCNHTWPRNAIPEDLPILLQPPSNTSADAPPLLVSSLLRAYFESTVDGGKCDRCGDLMPLDQSLRIVGEPPQHMFFTLNRFRRRRGTPSGTPTEASAGESEAVVMERLAYRVVADTIELPVVDEEEQHEPTGGGGGDEESSVKYVTYTPTGFTEHHGATLDGGHHTAIIRESDDNWYLYDDATVKVLDDAAPRLADVISSIAGAAEGRSEPHFLRYTRAS
mmetsp:Transcript_99/g.359  ORF Transcript_99/g.359 Transcript_99/m.359 type:complete len:616 (-) Transcript_99:63-1910(-)